MYLVEWAALTSDAMRSARVIQAELAGVLREYYNHETPGIRTVLLRRAAEVQFELRKVFNDLLGHDYGYREMVSEACSMAGIPLEERRTVLAAVRYHMMNVLRENLSPEEIRALHLRDLDGRGRARESRAQTRAELETIRIENRTGEVATGFLRAAVTTRRMLAAVKAADVRALSESDRKRLVVAVRAIRREADRLLRLAEGNGGVAPRKKK